MLKFLGDRQQKLLKELWTEFLKKKTETLDGRFESTPEEILGGILDGIWQELLTDFWRSS